MEKYNPCHKFSIGENRRIFFAGRGPEAPETPEEQEDVEAKEKVQDTPETIESGEAIQGRIKTVEKKTGKLEKDMQEIEKNFDVSLKGDIRLDDKEEDEKSDKQKEGKTKEKEQKEKADAPENKNEKEPLSQEGEELAKAMEKLGMSKEGAEGFARAMQALAAMMKSLQDMFKEGSPGVSGTDDGVEDAPNEGEPSETPEVDEDASEGEEGSPEAFDPTKVQNPKKEAEALGDVVQKEKELEEQLKEIGKKLDGDTTVDEREQLMEEMQEVSNQLKEAEENVQKKDALENEHERRTELVGQSWQSAVEKSGLPDDQRAVTNIELGGDGDDIVLYLNEQLNEEAVTALQAMGFTAVDGKVSISIENASPKLYSEGKAQLQEIFNRAAEIPFRLQESKEKKDILPAKDAPFGQIREDIDGNFWQKTEEGWVSYNDPENDMNSDSGYKNTVWSDGLMDERTERIVETAEEQTEIPPAKEAPVGQVRKDKEGNFWTKGENGMWNSYHNPERGMTSDSGFRGTEWGDSMMDENTAEIVNEGETEPERPEEPVEESEEKEKPKEASEAANESLMENLREQQNRIVEQLDNKGIDGHGILEQILEEKPEYAVEELVKPENREVLVQQQMHMRELEKAAIASKEWSSIAGFGKTNGKDEVYMYKLDGESLVAFTPGDYQRLDLASGVWSKERAPRGLQDTYTETMNNFDASSYELNTQLENALKGRNADALDDIAKDSSIWTAQNSEILIRLGFEQPENKEGASEKKEFPPAKDAQEGELRMDTEGNYWVKLEGGMWGSYNSPKEDRNSDSGYKDTLWGDSLMDERTAEIVGVVEPKRPEEPEEREESPEDLDAKLQAIEEKFSELESTARGYPGNESTAASGRLLDELNASVGQVEDRSVDLFIGRITSLQAEFSDGSRIRYDMDQEKFIVEREEEEVVPSETPESETPEGGGETPEETPSEEPAEKPEREVESPSDLPEDWEVKPDKEKLDAWLKMQENTRKDTETLGALDSRSVEALKKNGVIAENSEAPSGLVAMEIKGEQWEIGVGRSGLFYRQIVLRKSNDHSTSVMLPDGTPLDKRTLLLWAERASKYRQSEVKDAAGMSRGFEVADKEPMAFIELADLSDRLTRNITEDSYGMPQMLAKRYNVVQSPESKIDASKGDNPMGVLRNHINNLHEKGVRNFYLSVYAHGSERAMHFGGNEIKPSEMTTLFKEFPDCRFTLNAIACFGGGLAKEMKQFKDNEGAEKGRVSVFTQTKGDVVNFASVADSDYSTLYNAALANYLMQGVDGKPGKKISYGQAHLLADQYAKQGGFTDAEVHSSRPNEWSAHTASVQSTEKFGQVT